MLESPVKILHTADIQIEVRGQHQRRDEFEFILKRIEDVIIKEQPDILIWVGDIFEHHRPNDIERGLFIDHLQRALKLVKEIVITDGNHDIDQQQASNFFVSHGHEVHSPNALVTIVEAINDLHIIYMNDSTIYKSNAFDIIYYNWAQRVKHSAVLNKSYNPLNNDLPELVGYTPVTIYHDPIRGARMWDDKEMRGSEKQSALDVFCTRTIFAGDIHIPQVITSDDKTFIYCGSPVPRNFGEGDYVLDSKIRQHGMNRHCISVCELQPDGTVTNQEFIPIKQYRSYTTFELTTAIQNPADEIWEIPYNAYDNIVRIKLPSATETYLAWEPTIIEAIHHQNPNIENITTVFSYGRAITTEVDEIVSTQDIHQLISESEIVRVADEYIKKQVNDSRSIPTEDKDKCIKLVTELFTRELKNYISNIPSNHIKLLNAKISNFMAFGNEVCVDLTTPEGLIKLTGGNGVGKTTFYNAIKWCITGFISLAQNRKLKNENNLLVFNDFMWNRDEVKVFMLFDINGEKIEVIRTTTRAWKKGTTDEQKQSKKWKNYIANTDSTITVTNKSTLETKTDIPAEQILQSVFCGLENLSHTVFPSQFTLKSVICTEPARLCEEILRNIGMSFFDKMYDKYDDVRNNIMSKITKPANSVEAIISKISEYEKDADILKSKMAEHEVESSKLNVEIENINKEITELHKQLDSTVDTTKADELLKQINERESAIAEKRKQADEEKHKYELYVNTVQWDKYDSVLKEKLNEISANDEKIADTYSTETQLTNQISDFRTKIFEQEKQIRAEFDKQKSELVSKLAEHQSQLTQHTEDLGAFNTIRTEAINNITTRIQESINKFSIDQQQKKFIVSQIEKEILDTDKKINELRNSTSCPTCGRAYDEKTVAHIIEEISKHENIITELTTKLSFAKKDVDEITEKKSEYQAKLELFKSNPDMTAAVSQYTQQINSVEVAINSVKKSIDEIKIDIEKNESDAASYQDLNIENWKSEISTLKSNLTTVGVQRQSYIKTKTELEYEYQTLKDNYAEYQQVLKKLDELKLTYHELETEAAEISRLRGEHTRMVGVIQQNKELAIKIHEINKKLADAKSCLNSETSKLMGVTSEIAVINERISEEKTNKINAIKYRIVEASLKQYKTLIGKNGLPQHIFSIIREVLNAKLNDLLDDMDFRLMFDNSNQLIMVDLSKPGHPIRRPSQLSGMQTCFTGLALVYVNRMCNNTFIFDHIFIDEVSGQLNSGEELTYGSMNYQEQLKKLLRKFAGLKVWIVDHVIDDLHEDYRFEVVPSDTGSVIRPLSKIN